MLGCCLNGEHPDCCATTMSQKSKDVRVRVSAVSTSRAPLFGTQQTRSQLILSVLNHLKQGRCAWVPQMQLCETQSSKATSSADSQCRKWHTGRAVCAVCASSAAAHASACFARLIAHLCMSELQDVCRSIQPC